jgi:uncharacterized protein
VVDAAGLLKSDEHEAFVSQLRIHEAETTQQVVVATISSLDGLSVEDYANRLFRHWGLGQKDKDNGVLLLVSPSERKVRIEVGYGLEGQLTDALSRLVIETAIIPLFRRDDYAGGIGAGIDAILDILGGNTNPLPLHFVEGELPNEEEAKTTLIEVFLTMASLVVAMLFLFWILSVLARRYKWNLEGGTDSSRSSSSDSSSSSSSNRESYSGGGGSSGGGGASGSW